MIFLWSFFNMKENNTTKLEATAGMTLLDAVPVILFAASMSLMAVFFSMKSLWTGLFFGLGALLSFLAGLGKVIWKFLLVTKKKDVSIFKKQFRYLMSSGFLLMLIGAAVYIFKFVTADRLINVFWSFPGTLFLVLGLGNFIAMCVYGAKADMDTTRANWTEEILNTLAQFFIFVYVIYAFYGFSVFTSYSRETVCDEILSREESVSGLDAVIISVTSDYIFFDGEGTDTLLVFYPGGLVDHKAYVPFMNKFAEAGIDAVLLKVPCDLAIYKTSAAKLVLKKFSADYEKVFLGGHSLGGAVASMYAPKTLKKYSNISGLILFGAYTTNQFDSNFKVISVKGENDKVLNKKKYDDYMLKLISYDELTVPGGNHANFGHYGPQKGDGSASISADMQQYAAVEFVKEKI